MWIYNWEDFGMWQNWLSQSLCLPKAGNFAWDQSRKPLIMRWWTCILTGSLTGVYSFRISLISVWKGTTWWDDLAGEQFHVRLYIALYEGPIDEQLPHGLIVRGSGAETRSNKIKIAIPRKPGNTPDKASISAFPDSLSLISSGNHKTCIWRVRIISPKIRPSAYSMNDRESAMWISYRNWETPIICCDQPNVVAAGTGAPTSACNSWVVRCLPPNLPIDSMQRYSTH